MRRAFDPPLVSVLRVRGGDVVCTSGTADVQFGVRIDADREPDHRVFIEQ